MSVYIKGMEMPTSCCECPLTYYEDGTCIFTGIEALSIGIQKDCPLIPVPDHGRCVDADALESELWKMRMNYQMMDDTQTADKIMWGLYRAEQALKSAPTIIPADGEGEGC